jgi:hypothetical protein
VDATTIFAGIGAILTAAGGVALVIREFRRRDHRSAQRSINDLHADITALRHDVITCRRYAYLLAEQMSELGIEPCVEKPVLESAPEILQ